MGSSSSTSWHFWYRLRVLWDTGFILILSFINCVICKGLWVFIYPERWDRRLEPSNYQQKQFHIQTRPVSQKLLFRNTFTQTATIRYCSYRISHKFSNKNGQHCLFLYLCRCVWTETTRTMWNCKTPGERRWLMGSIGEKLSRQVKKGSVVKNANKLRHTAFYKPTLWTCKPLHKW